jgi:hypothetical protein
MQCNKQSRRHTKATGYTVQSCRRTVDTGYTQYSPIDTQ